MSSASRIPDGVFAPLEPPKAATSKRTKWIVLALILIVCVTPSLGIYWVRQHYQVFESPADSMNPTIRQGDRVLADMYYFRHHTPARGDVVLIRRPNNLILMKRLAALPGDIIMSRDGVVFINGSAPSEPYAHHSGTPGGNIEPVFMQNFGPLKVNAGECFVMGDNRDISYDSRSPEFGPVALADIIGHPLYILSSTKGDRAWERIK
jgi:signal peptidase I